MAAKKKKVEEQKTEYTKQAEKAISNYMEKHKPTPVEQGLANFYSSQAKILLDQYENINQLLGGKTSDWLHPGTHCEVLLRDFLKKHLLKWMSVDKGYVHGRVNDEHGPEIDLLIHNERDYSPLFRVENFVIVSPEAVLGIIQVKRTFSLASRGGEKPPLRKGLEQVIRAKQHLFDCLIQNRPQRAVDVKSMTQIPNDVFAGLVAFEEDPKDISLENEIRKEYEELVERRTKLGKGNDTSGHLLMLPTFVGSLTGTCAVCQAK
jgi:hypothetical protein